MLPEARSRSRRGPPKDARCARRGYAPLRMAPSPRPRALPASLATAAELGALAGDFARLAWRVPAFWFEQGEICRRARRALAAPPAAPLEAAPLEAGEARLLAERPLEIFVSWAEASGELHAANLVRALGQELAAAGLGPARFSGLGGARRAAELGVELVAAPADHAVMGFAEVVGALPKYVGLVKRAAQHLRERRPAVCVLVDSPGLHVPLGRIARRYGVPVVHYIAPQLWAWAPWRLARYRSAVDLALSILPFEPAWFAAEGVDVAHVGHPLLDELAGVPATRPDPASRRLAILPGSRASVVRRNLPWMLARARELLERHPELEVRVLQERAELGPPCAALLADAALGSRARLVTSALHAELARARAVLSVSGTVLLDVLHHRVPAVVVYRLSGALEERWGRAFLTTPWFASPNLLANREVVPEFAFAGLGPEAAVSRALERAWSDETWRAACVEGLELAAARLGPSGATLRAARAVLATAAGARAAEQARQRAAQGPA